MIAITNNVPFFTPVDFNGKNDLTTLEWLIENVDSFFSVCGEKAYFTDAGFERAEPNECSMVTSILKVIAYMTIVLPFIFFIAKVALRCTHTFEYKKEIADEKKSMLARNEMQIPKTELLEIVGDLFPEASYFYLHNSYIIPVDRKVFALSLSDALNFIVDKINSHADCNTPIYFTRGPLSDYPMQMGDDYTLVVMDAAKEGVPPGFQEKSWLEFISETLASTGYIHGYTISDDEARFAIFRTAQAVT